MNQTMHAPHNILQISNSPGLLVSVRNAAEAITALEAGADVIDVKEPNRGALGAADCETIAAVVRAVAGRAPVTAALGELADFNVNDRDGAGDAPSLPAGVSLFKLGLARCTDLSDWQSHWRDAIAAICRNQPNVGPQPVAVVYADWRTAAAPSPDSVLEAAISVGTPVLLVDTFNKGAGNLFNHWPVPDLRPFIHRVREANMTLVLAGSLTGDAIATAAGLGPALIAVRGAACKAGRGGTVSADRVASLKSVISQLQQAGERTTSVVTSPKR